MNNLNELERHQIKSIGIFAVFAILAGIACNFLVGSDIPLKEYVTSVLVLIPVPIFLWNFSHEELPFISTLVFIVVYTFFLQILLGGVILSTDTNFFSFNYLLTLLLQYLLIEGVHKTSWIIMNNIALFNVFFYILISFMVLLITLGITSYNFFCFIPLIVIPRFFEDIEKKENILTSCLKKTAIISGILLVIILISSFIEWLDVREIYQLYGRDYPLTTVLKEVLAYKEILNLVLLVSFLTVPDFITKAIMKPILKVKKFFRVNKAISLLSYIIIYYVGIEIYLKVLVKITEVPSLGLSSIF